MDPSVKWIVQKYGGTSVGKFAVQIAQDIVPCVSSFSRLEHDELRNHTEHSIGHTWLTIVLPLCALRGQDLPKHSGRLTFSCVLHLRHCEGLPPHLAPQTVKPLRHRINNSTIP
jgi:hypothetical protein